jgi:hypothetical protein
MRWPAPMPFKRRCRSLPRPTPITIFWSGSGSTWRGDQGDDRRPSPDGLHRSRRPCQSRRPPLLGRQTAPDARLVRGRPHPDSGLVTRQLAPISVKGKSAPIEIYEVLSTTPPVESLADAAQSQSDIGPHSWEGICPIQSLPAGLRSGITRRHSAGPNALFSTGVSGGARRNRTDDLLNAIQALSQLSYDPTESWKLGLFAGERAPAKAGGP